jgi:hypothetical protein
MNRQLHPIPIRRIIAPWRREAFMTAFNIVRFRVKPGREQEFIDAHKKLQADIAGSRRLCLVKTGDRSFCFVGEWNKFDDIVAARGKMGGILDGLRPMLEDLGSGLGVTDPMSGELVAEIKS